MNTRRRRIQKARRRRGRIADAIRHARKVASRCRVTTRAAFWLRPNAEFAAIVGARFAATPPGVPIVHAAVRTSTGEIGYVGLAREECDVLRASTAAEESARLRAQIERDEAEAAEMRKFIDETDAFLAEHAHLIPNDGAKK